MLLKSLYNQVYAFLCAKKQDSSYLSYKIHHVHECSCFIEFTKRIAEKLKMRGLPSILLLFRNEFST